MGAASSTQEALKDKNYDGQDMLVDPELQFGPYQERKCTDVFWLLVFAVFLGGYGWTMGYGYANGRPNWLFSPVDDYGNICGIDAGYEDHPYLYYLLMKDDHGPKALCVKDCPNEITDPVDCIPTMRVRNK